MNKKLEHSRLYLIILISVFSLVVIGATYAIFASDKNFDAMANLQAHAGSAYAFTSTSATDFTIDLKASDMKDENIGNYVSSTNGTINVSLTSPEGMATYCTYDLLFTWNSSDKYTTPDVALPYTHTDNKTYNYEFSTLVTDKDTGNIEFAERDLSKVNNGAGFSGNSGTIAEGLSIEADSTTVSKTYNIDARIYILPIIQNNIEGKNMHASIKVDNVNCQYEIEEDIDVSTLNYLSTNYGNTIFNLVSNQGVNVSSVDNVYFVDTRKTKPGNAENIALFRGTDNNVIKAWTNGNNLYIGSKGTTYPGPSMAYAFSDMRNLNLLDMNNVNTSNVTDMTRMFYLTGQKSTVFTLNLGNEFNTSKVTTMHGMFWSTGESSTDFTLNLGNEFNTSNVTSMDYMFKNTGYSSPVFTLNLGNEFNTSNVTTMLGMFSNTGYSSTDFTLNLGNHFNTSNVTSMYSMFSSTGHNSTNFTLNLGNEFNTSNVTSMYSMFSNTGYSSANFTLNLGNEFNTAKVEDMSYMFRATGYKSPVFTLNLGSEFNTSNVTRMASMFDFTGLKSTVFTLNLGSEFNTSKVTSMASMFDFTGSNSTVFTLNLGNQFNTANVTDMRNMFTYTGHDSTVFTLNLGNEFNTSNVTSMFNMFCETGYRSPVFTLNLGNQFNTSNVTNMEMMFSSTGYSSPVFTLNLGNEFNTSNVTNMQGMFSSTGYKSTVFTLNLGNEFNTSKVTNMSSMFSNTGYSSSWTLNLKSFDFSKVGSNYSGFFRNRSSSNILTVLCSPTNGDFINARVSGLTGYNVVCS